MAAWLAQLAASVGKPLLPAQMLRVSHQDDNCDLPFSEGALAGVLYVWAQEVAPPTAMHMGQAHPVSFEDKLNTLDAT
jgi:hypothetical protein